MPLTPLVLAPLTILASRSLAGDAALSGRARRTAETNLRKQEAFLAPHRAALAGEPFQGIQGGGLNAAEIAEVERRAVIDVDSAIAFGSNRSALRVDQFRSERINARQQMAHEQSTLTRDLQIKELQRVEQQRVASVAAQENAVAAERFAATRDEPTAFYDFRDPDIGPNGATVRAWRVGTTEFKEIFKQLNADATGIEVGNQMIQLMLDNRGTIDPRSADGVLLNSLWKRYQLVLKDELGLGAIQEPDVPFIEALAVDPNSLTTLILRGAETAVQAVSFSNDILAARVSGERKITDKWVGMEATNTRIDAAVDRQAGNSFLARFFRSEQAGTPAGAGGVTPGGLAGAAGAALVENPGAAAAAGGSLLGAFGVFKLGLKLLRR